MDREGSLPSADAHATAATQVLLTIDADLAGLSAPDSRNWEASRERSSGAAGVDIGYQLRMLAQYALKACFFVDPMPACRFGIDPIRRIVEPIIEAGQEIQLRPHPAWMDVRDGRADNPAELASYGRDAQRTLIARARDLLVEAGVPDPIAFRGANFSANDDTLSVLAELGFRFDSSHNGHLHPWPSAIGLPRDQIAPVVRNGVIELPVTVIDDSLGLRDLRISAISHGEMKAAIEHGGVAGLPLVNIVMHSFELANRAGSAPDKVRVRRFENLCAFLCRERRRFPTTFFTEIGNIPLDRRPLPLSSGTVRRWGRMIEQVWSNRPEERWS